MQRSIELNGIANILILIEMAENAVGHEAPDVEDVEAFKEIKNQVDLLERYMIAFAAAVNNNRDTPFWHEVREAPQNYPLNKDT